MNTAEWGFEEAPESVDIDRLWSELMSLPSAFAFAYLHELKTKAPRTYARLRSIRLEHECRIFNWDESQAAK